LIRAAAAKPPRRQLVPGVPASDVLLFGAPLMKALSMAR
jgi:hypothetical protein